MIVIRNSRLRMLLRWLIPCVAIPAVVLLGAFVLDEKLHLAVSMGVAVLAAVLFVAGFERRKTGARRLVLAAVMTALCVVGRLIPFFKPVTALTVLAAMYLGGETGFLVGALAAVLSNFYFGQGPWTPFQMLAWGLIGLLAGVMAQPLKRSRVLLIGYGVLAGAAYSMVMDLWTVLWYEGSFHGGLYLTALAAALPHTLMYSLSNMVFLWVMARPVGQKLERVRVKYGL